MSSPEQDPSAATGGRRAVRVAAVVAGVLLVVVVALVVVVRGGGPGVAPTAGEPGSAGAAAYDDAFARTRALTETVVAFDAGFSDLARVYEETAEGPRVVEAEAAYDEVRTAYEEGVAELGRSPAMQDAQLETVYTAFRDRALASIAYGDYFAGVKRALTVCSGVFELDEEALAERLPAAHQAAADACRPVLAPLMNAPFPVVSQFATAFGTLLEERQVIYEGVFGFGSISPEDGAAQVDASYARFAPTLDALSAPDGLAAVKEEVDVTASYQALYGLLVERTAA